MCACMHECVWKLFCARIKRRAVSLVRVNAKARCSKKDWQQHVYRPSLNETMLLSLPSHTTMLVSLPSHTVTSVSCLPSGSAGLHFWDTSWTSPAPLLKGKTPLLTVLQKWLITGWGGVEGKTSLLAMLQKWLIIGLGWNQSTLKLSRICNITVKHSYYAVKVFWYFLLHLDWKQNANIYK